MGNCLQGPIRGDSDPRRRFRSRLVRLQRQVLAGRDGAIQAIAALYPGALDEPVTVGGLQGKTLLVYASYENKVALINRLLEAGSDTCAKDANGEFPLLAAVVRRKWHLVRRLLDAGADRNMRTRDGNQLLTLAVDAKDEELVEILSPKTIDNVDSTGYTALYRAVMLGEKNMVSSILGKSQCDINREILTNNPLTGFTALHASILHAPHPSGLNPSSSSSSSLNLTGLSTKEILQLLLKHPGVQVDKKTSGFDCNQTAFHMAVHRGLQDFAFDLAMANADVNLANSQNEAPLHTAVLTGNAAMVDFLLSLRQADVNIKNSSQDTPLHIAVFHGHLAICQLLVNYPFIDVNPKNSKQQTPLHVAVECGRQPIVTMLVAVSGIQVNVIDSQKNTPLHLAVDAGNVDVVTCLLTSNGDMNIQNGRQDTPLMRAICKENMTVVNLFLSLPDCDCNIPDCEGLSPLHVAVARKQKRTVEVLLSNSNCDVNAKTNSKFYPVHFAIDVESVDILQALLKHSGVQTNVRDPDGNSLLHLAVEKKNVSLVVLLLTMTPNPTPELSARNNQGKTVMEIARGFADECARILDLLQSVENGDSALIWTIKNQNKDILRLLLSTRSTEVNKPDAHGKTSIHWAVQVGDQEMMDLIYVYGGDQIYFNHQDDLGRTPLHWAIDLENIAMARVLIPHMEDVNLQDKDGETCLHMAVKKRHRLLVRLLLENFIEKNIDLKIKDNQGRTVFKVACDDSEQIIMDMIMEKLTYLNPDDFEVTQYRIDYLGESAAGAVGGTRVPTLLCMICCEEPVYIKFSPCCHSVTCIDCAIDATRCPQCDGEVLVKLDPDGYQLRFDDGPDPSSSSSSLSAERRRSRRGNNNNGGNNNDNKQSERKSSSSSSKHRQQKGDAESSPMKCSLGVDGGASSGVGLPSGFLSDAEMTELQQKIIRMESELRRKSASLEALQAEVLCNICFEKRRDTVFNCGHTACTKCSEHLANCHMCRIPITAKIKMFA